MKTYVFIIRRICNITGAQQYVYNKVRYLDSQGWRVLVFSSLHGTILIDRFKEFEKFIIPALYFCPAYYRKGEVESTVNKVLKEIGDCRGDECIIESDSLSRSIWAELVASRLNCRHLAFFVQERHNYNSNIREFLRFKYDRHELAGISKDSLHQMFGNELVEKREDTYFIAYCNNVFDDCEDRFSGKLDPSADYTFGSLGRLGKACVPAIIEGFCSYASIHKDKRFNVVMIGGSSKNSHEDAIRKRIAECENINLVITGNLYPVPLSLAKKIQVFVSTAGSAYATYRANLPTIMVNPNTGEPIGVLGLDKDMADKSMYEKNDSLTIKDCLDRAIKERDTIEYKGTLGQDYINKMHEEFRRQLSLVRLTNKNEYYDEEKLMKFKKLSFYSSCKYCLLHLFGSRGQRLAWRIMRNQ